MWTKPKYKYFSDSVENRNYKIPIYRFLNFDYLINLIKEKKLRIYQTIKWDDVYENFLAKTIIRYGTNSTSLRDYTPAFYGQCWTLTKESDALWRIYSHDKRAVRIKIKLDNLGSIIKNDTIHDKFSTHRIIIGKVKYMTNSQINKWIQSIREQNYIINDEDLTDSLFIKRNEFKHENEVRLIIHKVADSENENQINPFVNLEIDPNNLIDQITFDPRINDDEFETFSYILRNIGFNNKIDKSSLYKFENYTIK